MARINIYVPDELKARMDSVGDAANWSEVARPAIQAAVANHEHRKGRNMTTAIERLRASKQELSLRDRENGRKDGANWAKNHASYEDLVRLSKERLDGWEDPFELLENALSPENELTKQEVIENTFSDENASAEHIAGFIEGAQQFFEEVRGQL